MQQFSVEEVQNWFETFDEGFFKDYAKNFARFDGDDMMKLSKDDCIRRCPEMGDAIYNQWHQTEIGIIFFTISSTHCHSFLNSYFFVVICFSSCFFSSVARPFHLLFDFQIGQSLHFFDFVHPFRFSFECCWWRFCFASRSPFRIWKGWFWLLIVHQTTFLTFKFLFLLNFSNAHISNNFFLFFVLLFLSLLSFQFEPLFFNLDLLLKIETEPLYLFYSFFSLTIVACKTFFSFLKIISGVSLFFVLISKYHLFAFETVDELLFILNSLRISFLSCFVWTFFVGPTFSFYVVSTHIVVAFPFFSFTAFTLLLF